MKPSSAKSMRSRLLLGNVAGLNLLLASLLACWAAPSPNPYAEGELVVKFKGGPRGEPAAQAQRGLKHEVKRNFDRIGWQHIQLPPGQSVAKAIKLYEQHPDVLAVEPNYLLEIVAMGACAGITPNDTMFSNQWALARIGATNAWCTSTGSTNVVMAVIDSGVDYLHEDLAPNMWRNPGETGLDAQGNDKAANAIDDDGNGYVDDVYGIDVVRQDGDPYDEMWSIWTHGTMVAGIIGAVGNNGLGVARVNWSVQLMAVRILGNSASSNYVASVAFVESCMYILEQKARGANVRVANHSYGFTSNPGHSVRDAIESLGDAGVLNVLAAGQQPCGSTNLDVAPIVYPQVWHLPTMINVAASDTNDNLDAGFSNWGPTNVDLAAPGIYIAMTQGDQRTAPVPHHLYYSRNNSARGTSLACPHVAGAAALLAAAYPSANLEQLKTALLLSVDVVGDLTNKVASKGRLSVARAIEHPGLNSNAPPFLFTQPQSQTCGLGCPVTFYAIASGPTSSPLTFQWQRNGIHVANTTNGTLLLPATGINDAGDYQLLVSNDYGAATSAVATLTVAIEPVLLTEPQGMRVIDGADIGLSALAAGACPLALQWLRNGEDIPGATNLTLQLANTGTSDSGNYLLVVTNDYGSATSAVAAVSVLGMPRVVAPLPSLVLTQGANADLCLELTNTVTFPLGARWRHNGRWGGSMMTLTNLSAICTNLLNVQSDAAGTWRVHFTNAATVMNPCSNYISSSDAYVMVVVPPTNQAVFAGATANLFAFAWTNITYQWQFNGTDLTNNQRIIGATTNRLTISNAQPADAGIYTVALRDPSGQSTNFSARLDVSALQVQLVSCSYPPSYRCLEICWPEAFCLCFSSDLSNWTSYTGPIQQGSGMRCATIPLNQAMMFFKLYPDCTCH